LQIDEKSYKLKEIDDQIAHYKTSLHKASELDKIEIANLIEKL